ncbi:hypothetical protein TNCT_697061 [Trichonephila clavata]|uniref:Uncharacterized protein n=1 Tax=Trichonephila clavata TaxID=2740835 RepID=A0A8X6KRV3_TRICU|nr:hypothetical protein TNCT_697061 [Trichonephila clavata]
MRQGRRRMRVLLLKLQYLPPSTEERIFNLLTPFIFFLHVVSATDLTIICDKKTSFTLFPYGNELKSHWAQIILIFFKEYQFCLLIKYIPVSLLSCTAQYACDVPILSEKSHP